MLNFFSSVMSGRLATAFGVAVMNVFASVGLSFLKLVRLVDYDIVPIKGRKRGRIANVRWNIN